LHFGSIVAAAGSWLDARSEGGQWRLRIDDLDQPRVAKGSVDAIFHILEKYGLDWDGEPVYQSTRFDRYHDVVEQLSSLGRTYFCNCTRKDWQNQEVYPSTCRSLNHLKGRARRYRSSDGEVSWHDLEQGLTKVNVRSDVGDFLLINAHGIYSYQLANATDDVDMGVTNVVRGADLLTVTAAHIMIQQAIGNDSIRYKHLPLALSADGQKISKATLAPGVTIHNAPETLQRAFAHLGMESIPLDEPRNMLSAALSKWPMRQ